MRELSSIFLGKKERRKRQLFIELKTSDGQQVSTTAYMSSYPHTRKTFNMDVSELGEDIRSVYQEDLLVKTNTFLFLRKKETFFPSDWLTLFYVRRSCYFQVFDTLFQQGIQTFKELKAHVFYSQSAIYQSFKALNQAFNSLPITVSLAGIEGDEELVRHFLFIIYWTLFGGVVWPFAIQKEELLTITQMEGFSDRVWGDFHHEKKLFWLAITVTRIRNNQHIVKSIPQAKDIPDWITRLFDLCHITSTIMGSLGNEQRFLLKSLQFLDLPVGQDIQKCTYLADSVLLSCDNLEKLLVVHAQRQGWGVTQCQNLMQPFSQLRYYVREDLVDLIHWLEPECMKTYLQDNPVISSDISCQLALLPNEVASLYVLACRQLGLKLSPILRARIHSRTGTILPIKRFLERYDDYYIEVDQYQESFVDVLLTDLLLEYQLEESQGHPCILFEYPLSEVLITEELRKCCNLITQKKADIKGDF